MSLERSQDFRKWAVMMPRLKFPAVWEIIIMPPFSGAAVRFVACKGKHRVSVYADFDGSLGAMDEPYWEIYPDNQGDTSRFLLNETDELLSAISFSLGKMEANEAERNANET